MVTIIFRMRIKDGKEDEAIAALEKMCAAVDEKEPGTLAYVFHRLPDDANQLVLYESYVDDGDLQAHIQSPHFVELLRGATAEFFDTTNIEVTRLDRVAGFVRG